MSADLGLVGDIGGTNARFALTERKGGAIQLVQPKIHINRDYPSAEAAIDAYLAEVGGARPSSVVLSVAGPVTDGAIEFTNLDWELSEDHLRRHGGFASAQLINDFGAQALGATRVPPGGLRRIGPAVPGLKAGAIAVLGPGTGFGVGALVRDGGREVVLASEGGHAGFAPVEEIEVEIWRWFARRHDRVSIERVLSGPGLFELYKALAEIEGAKPVYVDQRQVQAAATSGDALAAATVDRFCKVLGSTAGDIALTFGARGGVYVSGGVAVGLVDAIGSGGFRARFEAKGRFEDYMRDIPTFVVLEPYAALLGAASLLPPLEAS